MKGKKVQKKFLNDTLPTLHKVFNTRFKSISFSTFCKYRPKNIVPPKLSGRDTCLCRKCKNFKLLFCGLKRAKVISQSTTTDLLESVCCSSPTESCFFRRCSECKLKSISFLKTDHTMPVSYHEWVEQVEERIRSKSKAKIPVKVVKKGYGEVYCKRSCGCFAQQTFRSIGSKIQNFAPAGTVENLTGEEERQRLVN